MAIYKLIDLLENKPIYGANLAGIEKGKYKYFRQTDLTTNEPKMFVNEHQNKWMKKGDFFISRAGTIDSYIHQKDENYVYAGYLVKYPLNTKKVFSKYIYYWTKSIGKKQIFQNSNSGSTMPKFNPPIALQLKIHLPSLKTQQQIIDIIEPLEKLELKIKKLNKIINFITKNTSIIASEKNDYNFEKGLLPIKNQVGNIPFLNVSAANNKINRYVLNKPNIKIGDVTISLDGNTGLVNNALEGFNGYLFKVTSKKWKNYQIYYSLKNKINQKIIKINETGTTIKHSSKSKKEILHLNFLEDFLLKEMFNLEIFTFKITRKLKKLKNILIKLLIN